MAWAEPATEVAGVAKRDAAKVRTYADLNEPFAAFVKRAVLVGGRHVTKVVVAGNRIRQVSQINVARRGDLFFGAAADKYWFAEPEHGQLRSGVKVANIYANR
jgi:hypothetical protein